MPPLNSRHNVVSSFVPENPKPGQIFTMPEGQVLGASHVISLMKEARLIGDALQLSPVINVTGKSILTRVTTSVPLRKGTRLRALAQQYSFKSAIFVQYFGWMGHEITDAVIVISDRMYRVEHALRVGPPSDNFFIYEKVCLTALEEKEK